MDAMDTTDRNSFSDDDQEPNETEVYNRLSTLETSTRTGLREDLRTTPLMTLAVKDAVGSNLSGYPVLQISEEIFNQYAVLGFHAAEHHAIRENEPILMNVNAPNSAFICGSQGSGKSYTLNCMLENCLVADKRIGQVKAPVAGVAFQYDPDSTASVAETAYLCSMGVRVNVLVSQSNEHALREAYGRLPGADKYLTVKPLLFHSSDLSTERMLRLMAFADKDGSVPLYMAVAQRILRQMAIEARGRPFDYKAFKAALEREKLTKEQSGPLNLRLELLESFLDHTRTDRVGPSKSLLDLASGTLTIIDLTDPFMNPASACVLFDVCLSIVKEQRPPCGLVVALDEAHKYMTSTVAASNFTDRLLGTIREQRHNATRVIIATQEPTISDKLLDLCTVSIIHRFTSPAWFAAIQNHLGAASKPVVAGSDQDTMFERIMTLRVGESLVFAPSAFLCLSEEGTVSKLNGKAITMKTRARLGNDGGMSVLTCAPDDSSMEQRAIFRQAGTVQQGVALPGNDNSETVTTFAQGESDRFMQEDIPTTLRREDASEIRYVTNPNRQRSHLVLICCSCETVVIVEFSRIHLPAFRNVDQKNLQGGIAYATCMECKLQATEGSDKTLNAFDTMRSQEFYSGKIGINDDLRERLRSHLGSTLGHKVTILSGNGHLVYMPSRIVSRHVRDADTLWIIPAATRLNSYPRTVLTAYHDGAFFDHQLRLCESVS